MGMMPIIGHRESENSGNRRNAGKRFRRRPAEAFDPARHEKRKIVDGRFGAGESSNRLSLFRYRKKETQRFGLLFAMAWNVCAPDRIRCAAETAAAA